MKMFMPRQSVGKMFVKTFVFGFGFLSGLWIHVGVDPEEEISKALLSVLTTLNDLNPSPNASISLLFWELRLLFWIIPIIGIILSVRGSYAIGGWLGLLAVGLAFIGGIVINSFGIWLLIVATILGLLAPSKD